MDAAIECRQLGKGYRLYRRAGDRVLDALGLGWMRLSRRPAYEQFWALRGMDLTVPVGQRLGIIGRNGAGKSTLLKLIAGALPPTEGTVAVGGQVQALMELGTGFHPEFTGRRNVDAALGYQGITGKRLAGMREQIIAFTELDDFIDQPIKTYSAGMSARLSFAVATAVKPEVLIVDEILGAGDAYFAGKCVQRMRELTDHGATVLFVSHDLGSVQGLCDRIIWIDHGKLVDDGEPLAVIKRYMKQVRADEQARAAARDADLQRRGGELPTAVPDASAPDGASASASGGIPDASPPEGGSASASGGGEADEAVEVTEDEYGLGGAKVAGVRLLDEGGDEVRVWDSGSAVSVELEVQAKRALPDAAAVFCIYTADGRTASQWVADSDRMGGLPAGRSVVRLSADPLVLGRGAYVASVGLFRGLRADGGEAASYHVIDRAVHFEVAWPVGEALDRGICVQAVGVEVASEVPDASPPGRGSASASGEVPDASLRSASASGVGFDGEAR